MLCVLGKSLIFCPRLICSVFFPFFCRTLSCVVSVVLQWQEAMDLSGDNDSEMKGYLTSQFSECGALMELIEATPPHQIHRRRIEVNNHCSVVVFEPVLLLIPP